MEQQGKRFHALESGRRQGRMDTIAAYCNRQWMAPFTIEGACIELRSAKGVRIVFEIWIVFETWIETCLIPTLKPG
jgi:hypothetical protein